MPPQPDPFYCLITTKLEETFELSYLYLKVDFHKNYLENKKNDYKKYLLRLAGGPAVEQYSVAAPQKMLYN